MLEEAKHQSDYLIYDLQIAPTFDRPKKNKPIHTAVKRDIQLKGCNFVNEIVPNATEEELEDILKSFHLDNRIIVSK